MNFRFITARPMIVDLDEAEMRAFGRNASE
jgi:hypothetical protein